MIAILTADRVDDDAALARHFSMIRGCGGADTTSKFLTRPASPFLSFRDQHEVARILLAVDDQYFVEPPPHRKS